MRSISDYQWQFAPPRVEAPSKEEIREEHVIALQRAKPISNPKLDEMAWAKTRKEFEHFSMVGIFYSLADLPEGEFRF